MMAQITYGTEESVTQHEREYLEQWKVANGVKSKKALYHILASNAELYLPEFKSQCVTLSYLEKIILKRVFSIPVA